MTICPQCKEEIDSNSLYCDQCGNLLYVCPSCNIIGKGEGKRCGQCGQLLVAATMIGNLSQQKSTSPMPTQEDKKPVIAPMKTEMPNPQEAFTLLCESQSVRLSLIDGGIIGRVAGNYIQQLSNMIYISGTHARLNKNGAQWSITDLGSRNGTKVNGVQCNPTLNFQVGDIIKMANFYDFKVK